MIVILIGIIILIITILLIDKISKKKKECIGTITVIWWLGVPIAFGIIMFGIFTPTKMGEWEVKEAIEPTLLSNEEESIFDEYTYQYIIPERWSTKSKVINYTTDGDVPILVKCERKVEPTIWTLGLGTKEAKYVFYSPNGTINYLHEGTIN